MRAASVVALVAAVGLPGCGARAPAGENVKLASQRLEELAQRQSTLQKQVEETQNRLFLLEDKVDTSRVAIERSKPPRLPVIRLRPPPSEGGQTDGGRAAAEDESSDGEEGAGDGSEEPIGGRSMVVRRSVVYAGDAGRGGPRPVLRLHESGEGRLGQNASTSLGSPDPAEVTEKLPVVPLPKRRGTALAPATPDVQPMQVYQEAMSKYRAGEHAAAADAFRSFFKRYGQHAYADNALYWLAECSYDLKSYRLALKLFRQLVEQYPSGNKAPDALLKMAYCYLQLNDRRNARAILGQVLESYPNSQVARLASQAMAKL